MTNILTTINQLQMTGIGVAVMGGIGVGGYLLWQWWDKEPAEILDDIGGTAEKIIGNPLGGAIKTSTGGAFNFKTRTFGTLGTAQDEYESDLKMKKSPGLKFLATVGVASPQLALVTGTGQLIKQGKDKKLAKELAAKGDSDKLAKQLVATQNAVKTKDAKKVAAIKISDPALYLNADQVKEIVVQVDKFVGAHNFLHKKKWTRSRKSKLKSALVKQKQFKYLINRGLFFKRDSARKVTFVNQRMFTRAVAKLLNPHDAVIYITKKNKEIVKKFLDEHGLSSVYR